MIIKVIPATPYKFGFWLYLNIPNKVTAVIVNAPYVAYTKPTGIKDIAFERQKIQIIILVIQKIVGLIFVNPSVVFKKPFDAIPEMIARTKNKYPDSRLILFIKFSQTLHHL